MISNNKRIALNTMIIYVRMIIVSFIGLFTTRYVLLALGVSDFGLYNIVGGILTILNIVSIAMYTTTRRYINVETGKLNGNQNKIFNICLFIHIGFAIITFILAESIGLFYINNYLNVEEGKLEDAHFIFQVSTIVSMLGIVNIPFQAVHNAYEKFNIIALIEIFQACLKIPLIIMLITFHGNCLRLYSVGMCVISVIIYSIYYISCRIQFKEVTTIRKYKDKSLYKEILRFNLYTSSGAAVYLIKNNGSNMIVNLFFGTVINGAYALAYQIENYVNLLVSNLSTASAPQITQSYSAGDYGRAQKLVEDVTRYTMLLMIIMVVVIGCDLEFILKIWLSTIPKYALVLCQWVLLGLLLRSFDNNITTLFFAHGELKQFTIATSILGIIALPTLYFLLLLGFPPETAIIVFLTIDMINKFVNLIIVRRITHLDVKRYLYSVYKPIFMVLAICILYYMIHSQISINSIWGHIYSLLTSMLVSFVACFYLGLKKNERNAIIKTINQSVIFN